MKEPSVAYYDLVEAKLLVGKTAYEQALQSGSHPSDIVSLTDAITNADDLAPASDPDKLQVNDWLIEDYIAYGKWVLSVLDRQLTLPALQRTYELGLGPEPQRLYRKDRQVKEPRFKGLSGFYKAVGSTESSLRLQYDSWTLTDTMTYVKKVADAAAEAGIRPVVEIFEQRAREGKGPSNEVVKRLFGQPYGKLMDMAGYPEPKSWSDQDYIDWGVRFTEANGRLPYHKGITTISKRFRGPSEHGIARRFGGILSFQTAVEQEHLQKVEREERDQKLLFEAMTEAALLDPLLEAMLEDITSVDETYLIFAKYKIARSLKKKMTDEQLTSLCTKTTTKDFVNRLRQTVGANAAAHIETQASLLGVFDILWPPNRDYLDYLKVN